MKEKTQMERLEDVAAVAMMMKSAWQSHHLAPEMIVALHAAGFKIDWYKPLGE